MAGRWKESREQKESEKEVHVKQKLTNIFSEREKKIHFECILCK